MLEIIVNIVSFKHDEKVISNKEREFIIMWHVLQKILKEFLQTEVIPNGTQVYINEWRML